MYIAFPRRISTEPDHGLPDARRPAEARGPSAALQRRRHPGEPDVRDADLAEAGQDGRPWACRLAGARRAGEQQLPLRPRPHEGLDGLREPRREHEPPDAEEFRQLVVKRDGGSIVRLGEIADVVLGGGLRVRRAVQWQDATFMASGSSRTPTRSRSSSGAGVIPEIRAQLPAGMKVGIPYDSTAYIQTPSTRS